MANYWRVIPRDLFNEADLLKCLGKLWVRLDDLHRHGAAFSDDPLPEFDVDQNAGDGSISVSNIAFRVHGIRCILFRPLNARSPWPLYVRPAAGEEFEELRVFDTEGDGRLSAEFLALIGVQS